MKRKLIIAPYEGQRVLFDIYRKDDPFCDVKFISKEELIKNVFYDYSNDAIKYLIKKYGYDLDYASRLMRNIIYIGDEDNKLQSLKKELLANNLLIKNELFEHELNNSEIFVHYYNDDPFIKRALGEHHFEYVKESGEVDNIIAFDNNDDQLFYIFNKIEELLSKGVSPQKIFVYGLNDDDEVIFDRLVSNYKINFINAFRKRLITLRCVRDFVQSYDGNLEASLECLPKDIKEYDQIKDLINEYYIEGISFNLQKEIFKQVFSKAFVKEDRFEEGIKVVNEPIIKDDEYLFIVNYAQGMMPRIYKDDDIFDDEEKELVKIPTSKDKNIAENNYLKNTLRQKGHIYFSCAKKNFSSKMMASPLKSVLNQTEVEFKPSETLYSLHEANLQYANKLDLKRKYLHIDSTYLAYKDVLSIPYRHYDPQISEINHFSSIKFVKLSYSSAKTYFECKYKFYLSHVVKVDDLDTTFNMDLGLMAHYIMEHIEDRSFDELYQEAFDKYKDDFSPRDLVLLIRLKEELRKTYNYLKENEAQIFNKQILRERKYTVSISDDIVLEGRIDKIIFSGDKQQYVSILDYKSGSESFNENMVAYGFSMQLPTYALMAKKIPSLKDKQLLMLAIQPLFVSSSFKIPLSDDAQYYANLKTSGVYLNDINALYTLDKSVYEKPAYLGNLSINIHGEISEGKSKVRNKEWFDDIAILTEGMYLSAGTSIQKNDFVINPKLIGGKLISCEYCPFKDICYHDYRHAVVVDIGSEEEDG